MQLQYKSDFPNQAHQLNVSISQHYFLLKDNSIKWQSKKFDVNWNNHYKTGKRHVVTYMLRDHFSNCFYAELHSVEKMPEIQEFLFNAWSVKKDYLFSGLPKCLIVPKNTQDQFPKIRNFFSNVENLYIQTPTSGFSSAVVSIKQWERFIRYFTELYSDCKNLNQFQKNIQLINNKTNSFNSSTSKTNNLKKWTDGNPKVIHITKLRDDFFSLFN